MLQLSVAMLVPMPESITQAVDTCREEWQSGREVFVTEGTICIKGAIEEDAVGLVRRGFEEFEGVDIIVVNSLGGSVEANLSIAETIIEHETSLIVDSYCLSSCANYLLPAAKYRYLLNDSIIGWHGGPPRTLGELVDMILWSEPQKDWNEAFALAEQDFLKMQKFLERQKVLYQTAKISSEVIYDLEIASSCMAGKRISEIGEIIEKARYGLWMPGLFTLTSYYGYSNIIRLGEGQHEASADVIRIIWNEGEFTDYTVDRDCLYKRLAERDKASK